MFSFAVILKFMFSLFLQHQEIIFATRKVPGALDPAVVFPPLRVQNVKMYYGHSRYECKWCEFFKLAIYRTFDVFVAIPPTTPPPTTSSPHPSHCDNKIPDRTPSLIPWSYIYSSLREEECDEIF